MVVVVAVLWVRVVARVVVAAAAVVLAVLLPQTVLAPLLALMPTRLAELVAGSASAAAVVAEAAGAPAS